MFRRSRSNINILVGIFMLVLLAVFAGPGALPRILSNLIPNIDESIPCEWLRQGINRAEHQSLLGRAANAAPLQLRVRSSPLPNTPDGNLTISIIITNVSIGTVAIYYNPTQVRIGDDGATSGLGVTFNSPGAQPAGVPQQISYPESDIRLLGPRQSCVHKLVFAFNQLPDPSITTGSATVKAYYRNTFSGITQPSPGQTVIYRDQGLWTGVVESESVPIPLAGS